MAKGIGLIGNFRGKVGNMVGYNLKDSNNKQTQGVRVYQPVVKNPKSYGQAEQRAKLMPINAAYRALKSVIDRGQESKAYGNKSRLAWLRDAIKNYEGMWTPKGEAVEFLPLVPVSKGSLSNPLIVSEGAGTVTITCTGATEAEAPAIGVVSTALLNTYPQLQEGDQITVIAMGNLNGALCVQIESFVLDKTSTDHLPSVFSTYADTLAMAYDGYDGYAFTTIVSREGTSGQHLRTTSVLTRASEYPNASAVTASKEPAIRSYMAGGVNSDWPEESIQ